MVDIVPPLSVWTIRAEADRNRERSLKKSEERCQRPAPGAFRFRYSEMSRRACPPSPVTTNSIAGDTSHFAGQGGAGPGYPDPHRFRNPSHQARGPGTRLSFTASANVDG
jgi:hypothetical protein